MGEGGTAMVKSPVPIAMKLVRADRLGAWLGALRSGNRVLAPVADAGRSLFRELGADEASQLDLASVRTVNSPKDGVLPQTDRLLTYSAAQDPETGHKSMVVTPAEPPRPTVLFGVRPCDAAAIELLDRVFLTGDFVDDQYCARRRDTTVVAVACPRPDQACFCTSFDLSPGSAVGADIVLYGRSGPGREVEPDAYFAVAYTDRGLALLEEPAGAAAGLAPVEGADGQRLEEAVAAFQTLSTPLGDRLGKVDVTAKLDGLFESDYWAKAAARCLSCGICTFTCPTCYCFGVADCGNQACGTRYRYWDACKFPHFMRAAGGHDPRPEKKNRTRQRFMHKLNYYHHRYGDYLCVGCGRCVTSCPVGLHLPVVVADVRGLQA